MENFDDVFQVMQFDDVTKMTLYSWSFITLYWM